jgi:peptidoglycan/xylan/chitin deacetylase (PgdA/CDA1 family)
MMTLKNAGWETILPGEMNALPTPLAGCAGTEIGGCLLTSPSAIAGGNKRGVTLSVFKLTSAIISFFLRKPPFYSPLLCRGDDYTNSVAMVLKQKETQFPHRLHTEGELKEGAHQKKRFHLIFDDGYEGIYRHAYPILEELGYKATVFIPSGFIGKDNTWDYHFFGRPFRHMNQQMLRDLSKAGWMIGSHGISHSDFLSLNQKQQRQELLASREMLSEIIEDEVKWISFPFGRYSKREIEASYEAGYVGAVVPVINKSVKTPSEIAIIIADAVYCWDPTGIIPGRLERGRGYGTGRLFRSITNKCSYGTVLYKRLFGGSNNLPEPLATDE